MAISREFEEETGVKTNIDDWMLFSIIFREEEYKVYFFYCVSDKVFSVKTIEKEEVFIYDIENLPKNIIFNLNWLIPMSLDTQLTFDNPILIQE